MTIFCFFLIFTLIGCFVSRSEWFTLIGCFVSRSEWFTLIGCFVSRSVEHSQFYRRSTEYRTVDDCQAGEYKHPAITQLVH